MSSPALSRKRTRSQLLDEDELSPEKGSTTTPLTSIKKRRLNTNGSSPATGITGSLKRTIGGIFSWGRKEKENLREEADEEDELASGESLDSGKRGAPEKDIYDFPVSEPEEENPRKRRERTKSISTPNKTNKSTSEKGSTKSNRQSRADEVADDIWDVPDEDTSAKRQSRKFASSAEKVKALLAPVLPDEDNETPTTRSPGRPKKSQILKEDKKLSNKAVRERLMAAASEEGNEKEEGVITPKRRKSGRSKEDSPAQSVEVVISVKRNNPERSRKADIPELVASTGKGGRPRRTSIDISESPRQVPKGILTPSKNRPGRPRKSVTFGEAKVDLGFKDIPGKKSKKSWVQSHGIAAEMSEEELEEEVDENEDEEDEDDDVACAICSGLKTTKKNPIILCDGEDCEYAVHKKCEKLSVVPEEDWFCKDCQSTPEPEVEDVPEEDIESDDSEDVACAFCLGVDSKGKNPIILCDGEDCDYAVHIKCCQLSAVPRGAWFCEECSSKEPRDALFPQLNVDLALAGNSNNLPDIEGFEEHLRQMQRTLLDKLTAQKRIRLRGYDEEMKKVHQVVEQTVLAGEGNSMLVIGARGSGKTTVSHLDTSL
jgi:origin recognition complex subunit 4